MPPDEIKMEPKTAIGVLENLHWQLKDQLQYAHQNAFKTAIESLEKQINGELVEVVRCKDCESYDIDTGYCIIMSSGKEFEDSWDFFYKNDYCSYGERRARNERDT